MQDPKMTEKNKSTTRRKFLKGAGAVAAGGAAVVAAPSIVKAAKPKVLKMQGAWGGGIFKEFAEDYVNRVNDLGGGELKIEYLDVGAVLKTAEIQTGVHKGVVDAGHLVTSYWYSKNAAASLFGTGPCWGWSANQLLGWINYGGGQELYNELIQKTLRLNLVGFLSGPMPAQPLGWFNKAVNVPDDIKGLKYRTVGLAADVMGEMGMAVAQLPGKEIQTNMERGVIDAAEFNNPTSDMDFGMQDVSKDYYLASFHQSQETFEIIFNKDTFDGLSPQQQAVLRIASEAASADMSWKLQDRYSKSLIELQEKHGVRVHRTSDAIMKAQLEAWDIVAKRFIDADPFFAKVVESQKAWAERVVRYESLNAPDYVGAFEHYFGALIKK